MILHRNMKEEIFETVISIKSASHKSLWDYIFHHMFFSFKEDKDYISMYWNNWPIGIADYG